MEKELVIILFLSSRKASSVFSITSLQLCHSKIILQNVFLSKQLKQRHHITPFSFHFLSISATFNQTTLKTMKVYLATQLLALCSVTAAFTVPQNQLMPSVVLKARDRGDSQQGELAKAEGRARTRDRGPTTTLDRMVPGGALDRARPGRGMRQRLPVLQNPRHDRAWDDYQTPVTVQGQSLRTWAFESDRVDSVRVFMATDGRPMNANVELWQVRTIMSNFYVVSSSPIHSFSNDYTYISRI